VPRWVTVTRISTGTISLLMNETITLFRQVQAERVTGLLEIGELTCPDTEKQLIISANHIGDNVAQALDFIAKTNVH
jgi:hypothetical protein